MAKNEGKSRRTNLEASVGALEGISTSTWFKPQAGDNVVRILPAYHTKGPNAGLFFRHARVHRGISIEGQAQTIACVSNFSDAPCPICQFMDALMGTGNSKDAKLAKKIRPQDIFLINLVDRVDGKVKKYGLKKSMMKTLRGYLMDEDYGDITDPKQGMDIKIEKEGEGMNTRYQVKVKPKNTPIGIKDWEGQMFDIFADGNGIDKTTPQSVYEMMKNAFGKSFFKVVDEPDEVDEEEEENEDGEGEDYDLDEMDRKELKAFIKEKELDIKVTKAMDEEDIREAIEELLDEESEEDEEEEDDED